MPGDTVPSWTSLRWTRPGRLLLLTRVHGVFAVSITCMGSRLTHSFLYAQDNTGAHVSRVGRRPAELAAGQPGRPPASPACRRPAGLPKGQPSSLPTTEMKQT